MTPDLRSRIAACIQRHPSKNNSAVADCFRRGVRAAQVAEVRQSLGPAEKTPPPTVQCVGKPVADLIRQFDELQKVRDVMRQLGRGRVLDDDEMRARAAVPLRAWNLVRSHPSLAQFRYKLPNQRVVWLHPEGQQALARAINLSDQ